MPLQDIVEIEYSVFQDHLNHLDQMANKEGEGVLMIKRENIRYGVFWVRLVCCIFVAVAVGNCVHFGVLTSFESHVSKMFFGPSFFFYRLLTDGEEIMVVVTACMLSSFLRLENPSSMFSSGLAFSAGYLFLAMIAYMISNLVMPIVSPVLGIVGSTVLLGSMAWSEERTKRQTLEELERVKQEFSDMLVHDLRRRVSSVMISAEGLEGRMKDDKAVELLKTIKLSAERVLVEVNDLLEIRKIQEGKFRLDTGVTELSGVLSDCIREQKTLAALLGHKVVLEQDREITVDIDRNVFGRIISNLIWNAVQHAATDSEVKVVCGLDDAGDVFVSVINSGRIIPPDAIDRIFDPFVTYKIPEEGKKASSTGLGLAFCRLAIQAHGGSIELLSPAPKQPDGVAVILHLPRGRQVH